MNPLKQEITALLADWCDGLLRHQINEPGNAALHGGLLCPDCGLIHGRCADALYPLLRRARETGEEKYQNAAQRVFDWSERCVSQPNGSYVNEPGSNPWTGITVFSAMALGEALHHHGSLLPSAVRSRWANRLARAAHWIGKTNWAEHGTINYPVSAAAALASASRALENETLLTTARHWAKWTMDFFLPNGILFGEGPRLPTPRGVYAVDPLYNMEESLPNLALYAEIARDEAVRSVVLRAFDAHLDFLLPDGFYDAGWGSRSFKWTLWGSRTSDGLAGLLPLAAADPRIFEAVRRNVEALRACSHDGLLYGGPHLRAQNRKPCIHHTFCHAKALAAALDADVFSDARHELPGDRRVRGITARDELGTTFVSHEDWRASFTASDVLYHTRGLRPSGGALTMLWHKAVGPLCVSSMSVYQTVEGSNMAQARTPREITVLTPSVECRDGALSSIFDESATLTILDAATVRATGLLTSANGDKTGQAFCVETRFDSDCVSFHVTGKNAAFILPVVSPGDEVIAWSSPNRVVVQKSHAMVVVEASTDIQGEPGRVFHFVPGLQAVRLFFIIPPDGLHVTITVSRSEKDQNRTDGAPTVCPPHAGAH